MQQSGSVPWPCSICWPVVPGAECNVVAGSRYRNTTLREIRFHRPKMSIGVLLGDDETHLENLVFDSVVARKDSFKHSLSDLFSSLEGIPETKHPFLEVWSVKFVSVLFLVTILPLLAILFIVSCSRRRLPGGCSCLSILRNLWCRVILLFMAWPLSP